MGDLARELRDDYPAVDIFNVNFGSEFAGKPYCVIPQDRVLAVVAALEQRDVLVEALQFIRDGYANQDVNHVDYRVKVYEVALDALAQVLS